MALLTPTGMPHPVATNNVQSRCAAHTVPSHRQYRRPGHVMLILAIAAWAVLWDRLAVQPEGIGIKESQVKAVFLYNFAQFVTWPGSAFRSPHTPITIGILGDDPFGPHLEEAIRDEIVDGRSLTVQRFKHVEDATGSHILFISKSEKERLGQILTIVQGMSILTVGETEAFARQGGIINFIIVDNKIRYEINVEAAKQANLLISSKLLRLAKIVGSDTKK